MPRISTITYGQVAMVADSIQQSGSKPTLRAVHEKVGSGSRTTIMKYLQQWHATRDGQDTDVSVPTDPSAIPAINTKSKAKVQEAKTDWKAELLALQDTQNMLMEENERQATEIAAKLMKINELNTSNAKMTGLVNHLKSDIVRLINEANIERQAAENARTAWAKASMQLESMQCIESDNQHLRGELDLSRVKIAELRETVAAVNASNEVCRRFEDLLIQATQANAKDEKGNVSVMHDQSKSPRTVSEALNGLLDKQK